MSNLSRMRKIRDLTADNARLTAERDAAVKYSERLRGAINGSGPRDVDYAIALEKERDRLTAEVAELRKDAARLYWLFSTAFPLGVCPPGITHNEVALVVGLHIGSPPTREQLNTAIDAAIAKGGKS